MKSFFDTSVLVAVFWEDHPDHKRSLDAFHDANKKQAACAAHTLAEVFAVMTHLPVKITLTPEQVMLFLQEIRDRLAVVTLDEEEYFATLRHAAEHGLTGGRVYDALLLRCAKKAKAETIYTWNLKHFLSLAPELSEKIHAPA